MPKCNLTYSHIAVVDNNSKATPCCAYIYRPDTAISLDEITSLNDVLVSETWNTVRREIEQEINYDVSCRSCAVFERKGQPSKRTFFNEFVQPNKFELQDLELALDFTCNMMCRICKPTQSSKWLAAGSLVEALTPINDNHYSTKGINPKYPKQLQQLIAASDFSKLQRLRFVGGEPLYSKHIIPFLKKVDREAGLENVDLALNTNGSIYPESELLDLLVKCKSLDVQISIDAAGILNEIIRPGQPWSKIQESTEKWAQLFKRSQNMTILTNPTISLLNVNKQQELIDWSQNLGLRISCHALFEPDYLALTQIPNSVREPWQVYAPGVGQEDFNNIITMNATGKNLLNDFIKSMTLMDEFHKHSFAQANPEIWDLVHQYK